LKEESARCYDYKIGVGEGSVAISWDGSEGVGVSTVRVENGSVSGVVGGVFGVEEGSRLTDIAHVGVGGQGMLELTKGWGRGGDGFSGRWGEGAEANEGTGGKVGLAR
jgi:hypothetical protein